MAEMHKTSAAGSSKAAMNPTSLNILQVNVFPKLVKDSEANLKKISY